MNIDFASAATSIRRRLEITQRDLASRLGVTAVHLCNIEKGRRAPSPGLASKYEDACGVDLYVYAWCDARSKLESRIGFSAANLLSDMKHRLAHWED